MKTFYVTMVSLLLLYVASASAFAYWYFHRTTAPDPAPNYKPAYDLNKELREQQEMLKKVLANLEIANRPKPTVSFGQSPGAVRGVEVDAGTKPLQITRSGTDPNAHTILNGGSPIQIGPTSDGRIEFHQKAPRANDPPEDLIYYAKDGTRWMAKWEKLP